MVYGPIRHLHSKWIRPILQLPKPTQDNRYDRCVCMTCEQRVLTTSSPVSICCQTLPASTRRLRQTCVPPPGESRGRCSAVQSPAPQHKPTSMLHRMDWIVQCFTSPPKQYRLYGRWFLQVKRPNQQYQSTEGDATKDKANNENN